MEDLSPGCKRHPDYEIAVSFNILIPNKNAGVMLRHSSSLFYYFLSLFVRLHITIATITRIIPNISPADKVSLYSITTIKVAATGSTDDKIEAFRARGAEVEDGAFGENLVVQGFDFSSLPVGTRFRCGEVVLEMTQIGKECHHGCAIFLKMGDCILPREGVFTRVLHGGSIRAGMEFEQIDGVNRDESL